MEKNKKKVSKALSVQKRTHLVIHWNTRSSLENFNLFQLHSSQLKFCVLCRLYFLGLVNYIHALTTVGGKGVWCSFLWTIIFILKWPVCFLPWTSRKPSYSAGGLFHWHRLTNGPSLLPLGRVLFLPKPVWLIPDSVITLMDLRFN